ncbi:hypothetical protein [Actibacterium lipolyticum]|uniref:Outer membrane protein transport protein (OMPP1/FadL/TodX) n=1 Tax=Actibacterium lipolyticum TaxID=1524263 RepID=A0A238JZQ0_9RHOB|nr:hypothetical protein [Actibacterium lipolyticum]SMX35176.1 Outer membrane protein transport protein (OMPP1/FadL/TodX) [Actibacterium lipolyticum]
MHRLLGGAALSALCAGSALAGGVERSSQSTAILFEQGTHAELTFGVVAPDVSGKQVGDIGFLGVQDGSSTGNVAGSYLSASAGFKTSLSDEIDVALIIDSPIGADVDYSEPLYLYGVGAGSQASIDSTALTALVRYKLPSNFSVFGGLRNQTTSGEVSLFTGYTMETTTESDLGYVVGAAWEKPEIAARVALTYNSSITHEFTATEGASTTTFSTENPQSVNLEFQTGVAADTLLFGSVRWVDWTNFDISPDGYAALTGGDSLVSYSEDSITYNLGLGRRFNETWSGALTLGYEEAQGGFAANLGPTDGYTSIGMAVSYTEGNMTITGGARYIWIGDAETESPLIPGATQGDFTDNNGVAVGVKMAYKF